MKPFFSLQKSQKFQDALNKTIQQFEAMSNDELLQIGELHAKGHIAALSSGKMEIPAVKHEMIFFMDHSASTVTATFTTELKMQSSGKTGYQAITTDAPSYGYAVAGGAVPLGIAFCQLAA